MKKRLFIAALAVTIPAQAEVFKCKDASGKTTYQPNPCQAAQQEQVKLEKADPKRIAEAQAKLQADLKVQAEKDAAASAALEKQQTQMNEAAAVSAIQNSAAAQQDQALSARRSATALEIGNIINAYRRH
jgi:sRNA-binding protein